MTEFWQAADHQFGVGKVHVVHADDATKTTCGKALASIGGRPIGSGASPNCKLCITSVEAGKRREQWMAEQAIEAAARAAAVAAEDAEWHARYQVHLRSPQWQRIRSRVLRRSDGMCEGCGDQEATQVHHLSYEHMGHEFLWELAAVCRSCHERWHEVSTNRSSEAS